MIYEIFQVREDRTLDVAYRAFDPARPVDAADYSRTYAGNIAGEGTDADVLERLYRKFNLDHPADFKSYSLSIADVVVLEWNRAYYCDTFGWHPLTDAEKTGQFV